MANKIKTGTIFIKEGVPWPESLRFDSEPCSNGWREVKNLDACGLGRKIREAGWTFFYMAGEIRASVVGFDREGAVFKAVKRVMAKLKLDKCNSLEITGSDLETFPWAAVRDCLGPCATYSAKHVSVPRPTAACGIGRSPTGCRLTI